MLGRRREAQAVKCTEVGTEAIAVSAAISAAMENTIAAPATALEIAKHLEATPVPHTASHASDVRPVDNLHLVGAVASQSTPPVIRANPLSTAFGDMVALMMNSPGHKHLSLAHLERRLIHPLLLN
jgi:hypothetical protein